MYKLEVRFENEGHTVAVVESCVERERYGTGLDLAMFELSVCYVHNY
jgi:hypothetical protein